MSSSTSLMRRLTASLRQTRDVSSLHLTTNARSSARAFHGGLVTASYAPRSALPILGSGLLPQGGNRMTSDEFHVRYLSTGVRFQSTEALPVAEEDDEVDLFENMDNLHPSSKKAVQRMGLTKMTEIQSKTFDAASAGTDVLGRARTGTGKTMAFLLPALQTLLNSNDFVPNRGIGVLVISPTRELAMQISEQARLLLSFHENLSSQVMFGGSPRFQDVRRMERQLPAILVATPGRLQDHLDSTSVKGVPFRKYIAGTKVLVLDEMDRLLDMGFRNEIDKIVSFLSPERQTLLFSATLPPNVRQTLNNTVKPNYITVDCVQDADPASHTNAQVEQTHVMLDSSTNLLTGAVKMLSSIMEDEDHKIVVFFPTSNMVAFYSELFHQLGKNVIEIHSRKSQNYRTSASNRFRELKRGVLFTSDVSARGVDYPNVTHVFQFGMPDGRETYIHRLGRTGRAGKKGQGVLVLSEAELPFLRELDGLDIPPHPEWSSIEASLESASPKLEAVLKSIETGQNRKLRQSAEDAYRSMLGYYSSKTKTLAYRSKRAVVRLCNAFAVQCGFAHDDLPKISPRIAKSMGFEPSPSSGLNIGQPDRRDDNERMSGGSRGSGRGGGRGGGGYAGGGGNRSRSDSRPPRRSSNNRNSYDSLAGLLGENSRGRGDRRN